MVQGTMPEALRNFNAKTLGPIEYKYFKKNHAKIA